jgi:hypothetical protein
MPTQHKFQKDLTLQHLDFEPTTLIVGTFNPALPSGNAAEWFYGRTDSTCLWDILPRLYGAASLINAGPAEWKQFCHDKQIALTDLISTIDDADTDDPAHTRILGGFSDNGIIHNFEDFEYVNVVSLLQRYPAIKNVYITRSIIDAFWRYLWNPVAHYCNQHNIHQHALLPPSLDALDNQKAHNDRSPDDVVPKLEDYILRRWQQDWHF